MIAKGLLPHAVLNPSRSWEIQRGHRDREDGRAGSGRPPQQSVAGDASVTGVRIAPIVTVTCRRRGLPLRFSVEDMAYVEDLVPPGVPKAPHNPDPPH